MCWKIGEFAFIRFGRILEGCLFTAVVSQFCLCRSNTTTRLLETLASRIQQAKQSDVNKAQQKVQQDHHLRSILMQIANTPSQGANGGGGFGGNGMGKSAYDRLGSDRVMGEIEMDDDMTGVRKKK